MTPIHPEDDAHEDFLWNRHGPADEDIARLERLLAPQAWRERPWAPRKAVPMARPPRRWRTLTAIAATLALIAFGLHAGFRYRLQWPDAQPWQITAIEGGVRIDGRAVDANAQLAQDAVLETGPDGTARLRVARIGDIVIGEDSRFSLRQTGGGKHRTVLEHGRLWAKLWAPPGAFGVATPAGDVFDLGCEFVLDARQDGSGALTVRSGWVQIDSAFREVLVPQGARVEFGPGGRPGTPYDLGADAAFLAALRMIDTQGADDNEEAIRTLVTTARPQDAISLLLLLQARPQLTDGPLFDRLNELMPATAHVTRAAWRERGVVALSPWWDALPYPRVKRWWLHWPDAFGARENAATLLREETH